MGLTRDEELVVAYREQVGREPGRLADDHPECWQWEYRGRADERETLLERLGGVAVAGEQEPLFDA